MRENLFYAQVLYSFDKIGGFERAKRFGSFFNQRLFIHSVPLYP